MRTDTIPTSGLSDNPVGRVRPSARNRGRLLVVLLLVAVASVFALGFVSFRLSANHRLTLNTGQYPFRQSSVSGWQRHFGLSSDNGLSLIADLSVRALPFARVHDVSGQVTLVTPMGAYPVRLDPKEKLYKLHMPDGRPLIYGTISGYVTTNAGADQKTALMVAFVPNGNERYMTLSVGPLGQHAEFVFGRSFFTRESLSEIEGQINR